MITLISMPGIAQARLTKEQIEKIIIPPFYLGEKDPELPLYPLLNTAEKQIGYVFQTIDLIQIAGFSGTPINLLVQMNLEGNFLHAHVLEHNEPVFVNGHGGLALDKFLDQYSNLSVAQNIKVMLSTQKADRAKNQVDGVAMATASVRIINETLLASALKIARQKLKGLNTKAAAIARPDLFEKKSFDQLLQDGLVKRQSLLNNDIEKLFKGTVAAGIDHLALSQPTANYSTVYLADLSVPTVAKNILSTETLKRLEELSFLTKDKVPVLIMADGRHNLLGEDFVPASVPEEITILQNELAINMRDAYIDVKLKEGLPRPEHSYIFLLDRRFGFDPATNWALQLSVTREKGYFQPEIVKKQIAVEYKAPGKYFTYPKADLRQEDLPPWLGSWQAQTLNLIILTSFLVGLYYLLYTRQSWLAMPKRLRVWRPLILLFTLVFIGLYGQAQLSIVTIIALVKTLQISPDFSFLLYDPLSTVLWLAVILSFFIWGRGTFCGWLCPYGVMQEYSAKLGNIIGIKPIRINQKLDNALKYLKYLVLFGIVLTTIVWPQQAEIVAEVEPFKTAVTLYFWRDWPFVAYALMWLIISAFVFKAFCRYLCPLGAFLSIGGLLRLPNWIPRREACGSPCQLCSVRCNYQSIKPSGDVKYSECFQCLDCVSIHDDETACVPLILKNRNKGELKPIPIKPVTEAEKKTSVPTDTESEPA